jgi:hypothetical protein
MRLAFKRGWWGAVLPGQVPKLTVQVGPVQVLLGNSCSSKVPLRDINSKVMFY